MHKFFTLSSVPRVTGDLWRKQRNKAKKKISVVLLTWLKETCCLSAAIYTRLASVTLPLSGITYKVAFLTSLDHNVLIIAQKAQGEQQILFRMPKMLLCSCYFLFGFVFISRISRTDVKVLGNMTHFR